MDLYFERHDGEAATVEDFVACMADASGRDLKPFFRWYRQAGTPEVRATGAYDARKKVYELTAHAAHAADPRPGRQAAFAHPARRRPGRPERSRHGAGDSPTGPLDEPILELTKRSQTFRFTNVGSRPVPSINRGFSAPIRLKTNLRRKGPALPHGQRRRSVQSLGSRPDARPRPDRRRDGEAQGAPQPCRAARLRRCAEAHARRCAARSRSSWRSC